MTFPLLSDIAFSIYVCSPLLPLVNRRSPDQGVSFAYLLWYGLVAVVQVHHHAKMLLLIYYLSFYLFFSFPEVFSLSVALHELSFEFKSLRPRGQEVMNRVEKYTHLYGVLHKVR